MYRILERLRQAIQHRYPTELVQVSTGDLRKLLEDYDRINNILRKQYEER